MLNKTIRGNNRTILLILLLLLIVLVLHPRWSNIFSRQEIPAPVTAELAELGQQAYQSADVPVAAVIIYHGAFIGRGFNTVNRDTLAGGHAEINAISDAMHTTGVSGFKKLDRDSLLLITTYEPCLMCTGALLEYGIRKVWYIKDKDLSGNWYNELRRLAYFARRRQAGDPALQDSLFARFRVHPKK
jgi:tRNA(Arg) A34 adenosine deaminase TadA